MALWTNEYVPSSVSSIRLELNLKQTVYRIGHEAENWAILFGEYFFLARAYLVT